MLCKKLPVLLQLNSINGSGVVDGRDTLKESCMEEETMPVLLTVNRETHHLQLLPREALAGNICRCGNYKRLKYE
jgi:hypothetical protein